MIGVAARAGQETYADVRANQHTPLPVGGEVVLKVSPESGALRFVDSSACYDPTPTLRDCPGIRAHRNHAGIANRPDRLMSAGAVACAALGEHASVRRIAAAS